MVETKKKILTADIIVPGRTRWTVFDSKMDRFYVNVSKPPQIVAIESKDPDGITASYDIPVTGPHGLDMDSENRRLFCACDQGDLFTVNLQSGRVSRVSDLRGSSDEIFYNSSLPHLYVATSQPVVIDSFCTETITLIQAEQTAMGAHPIDYNPETDKKYD